MEYPDVNGLGSLRGTGFPTCRAAGLVVACFVCASAAALEGTLLVANRAGGSISFFDLATRVEIARLPVGSIVPHNAVRETSAPSGSNLLPRFQELPGNGNTTIDPRIKFPWRDEGMGFTGVSGRQPFSANE